MKNSKKYVNLSNARRSDQKKVMEQIVKDGVCPFCENNLKKYHSPPIIKKTKYWTLTKNMFPYEGSDLHLIFINRKHKTSVIEMKNGEWSDLQKLSLFILKKFSKKAGSILIRFGKSEYTGASVEHLHGHFVFSDRRSKKYKPVRVKIS